MKGIKNFITGFSLSLISVSFVGQLYSPLPQHRKYAAHDITINLFKKHDASIPSANNVPLIKKVAKYSLINTAKAETLGIIPQVTDNINSIEGVEDDEIINVNIDDIVPIDFINTNVQQQAEILSHEEEELSAMLPDDIYYGNDLSDEDDPWEIAKGGKYVKNQKLLKEIEEKNNANLLANTLRADIDDNTEISHKVAERIKQSIIFPIPDEILNDEDLTPTFIKSYKSAPTLPKKDTTNSRTPPARPQKTSDEDMKIIKKAQTIETAKEETNSKSLLNSISSWFTPTQDDNKDKKQSKPAPSYSSQSANTQKDDTVQLSTNNEFASFYETLQETTRLHKQNKILPSELKLSFQPNRAEISGQTLRWLKAFSEAASADNVYLQVRLDAATPSDIQRKRLNLLYSIFINNGVDIKKIDTVFSSTEPNAFIIRSLTYN